MSKLDTDLLKLQTNVSDQSLIESLKKINILSEDITNAKLTKSNKTTQWKSYILYLSPASLSGYNVCPKSSAGCRKACLNSAGRGAFGNVQRARLRKTLYYIKHRELFLEQLNKQITKLKSKHPKLAIRLNGTSDLNWSHVIKKHPDVTFYDYTAILSRVGLNELKNYHLTFSAKENNKKEVHQAIKLGYNVAIVFDNIPETYGITQVIDGDISDARFLDKPYTGDSQGIVVGLTAKGKARNDISGFVYRGFKSYKRWFNAS